MALVPNFPAIRSIDTGIILCTRINGAKKWIKALPPTGCGDFVDQEWTHGIRGPSLWLDLRRKLRGAGIVPGGFTIWCLALKMQAEGRPVPADAWTRVVIALSESLNVRSEPIKLESRLYQDLGMHPDLD